MFGFQMVTVFETVFCNTVPGTFSGKFLSDHQNRGFLVETSNDIIAGNGRIIKVYMFIMWLYLFKKYTMLINFSFSFWCISLKVGIWITDLSGIQMVKNSPINEWSAIQITIWIPNNFVHYLDAINLQNSLTKQKIKAFGSKQKYFLKSLNTKLDHSSHRIKKETI